MLLSAALPALFIGSTHANSVDVIMPFHEPKRVDIVPAVAHDSFEEQKLEELDMEPLKTSNMLYLSVPVFILALILFQIV